MKKVFLAIFTILLVSTECSAKKHLFTIYFGSKGTNGIDVFGNFIGWGGCNDGMGICAQRINDENGGDNFIEFTNDQVAVLDISKSKRNELFKYVQNNLFVLDADSELDHNFIVEDEIFNNKNNKYYFKKGEYLIEETENSYIIKINLKSN
jgi:hypothetical protein